MMTTKATTPQPDARNLDTVGFATELMRLMNAPRTSAAFKIVMATTPNLWDVLEYGPKAKEIRYSRLLAWLLNPHAEHGLGSSFAYEFVKLAGRDPAVLGDPDKPRYTVTTEQDNIDILLTSGDFAMAIENKTDTQVHPHAQTGVSQLVWYGWILKGETDKMQQAAAAALRHRGESRPSAQGDDQKADSNRTTYKNPALVYLTLHEQPADDSDDETNSGTEDWADTVESATDQGWVRVSYDKLFPLLDAAIVKAEQKSNREASQIIRDFQSAIQRRKNTAVLDHDMWPLYFSKQYKSVSQGVKALRAGNGGFAYEIACAADYLGLVVDEPSNKPHPYSDLTVQAIAMEGARNFYEQLSSELIRQSQANGIAGVDQRGIDNIVRFIWDGSRRPSNTQAHDRSTSVQALIRRLFNEFSSVPTSETPPFLSGLHEPLNDKWAGVLPVDGVGITSHKGQGLRFWVKDADISYISYISGAANPDAESGQEHPTFPNDGFSVNGYAIRFRLGGQGRNYKNVPMSTWDEEHYGYQALVDLIKQGVQKAMQSNPATNKKRQIVIDVMKHQP